MNHRNIRQSAVIDQQQLSKEEAVVVGCGAIGRQVAIMLTTMGIGKITLIDKDVVNNENLGCQGFWESDIGLPKVKATAIMCACLNKGVDRELHQDFVEPAKTHLAIKKCKGAVFSCVDSMLARSSVFDNWLDSDATMLIDGRMSMMSCRCLSASNSSVESRQHYHTTIFPDSERLQEPCTAKATFFTANIIAGMMIAMWVNETFLKLTFQERDVSLNIPAFILEANTKLTPGPDPLFFARQEGEPATMTPS